MLNTLMRQKVLAILTCSLLATAAHAQGEKKQYLPLPDGSAVTIREGETPDQTWARAQRDYPEAFGHIKLDDDKIMDVNWFNECKALAARQTRSDNALVVAIQACAHQAVPKKCRSFAIDADKMGNQIKGGRTECVQACKGANYFSRNIGECSRG